MTSSDKKAFLEKLTPIEEEEKKKKFKSNLHLQTILQIITTKMMIITKKKMPF